jgi:hypothetical protein
MDNTNPEKWKCPEGWHSDCDEEWEISKLKELGKHILAADIEFCIKINTEDCTAVYFEVYRANKKVAEIYVNRAETDSDKPMFSDFYGVEENELITLDYQEVVKEIQNTESLWIE